MRRCSGLGRLRRYNFVKLHYITLILNAGKLYGVVLCCRPGPASHTVSQNMGGRGRRTVSSSIGGFQNSTSKHRRWSSRFYRQQSRFQETAALTGDVQADASLSGRGAPVAGRPPADGQDRRQLIGCWPRSEANFKFQDSYI